MESRCTMITPRRLGAVLAAVVSGLAFSGAAAAASAPAAITGPVTSTGPTSATVTGTVNPSGQATTWYVEYGTSVSYGSKTSAASVGSGTSNVAVSVDLAGLAPGTTYHYRLVASNASGTSQGSDGIFGTTAAPGAVTAAPDSVTASSATLHGTVDPNGLTTTWYFEYGTGTSYGSKTATGNAGAGTDPVSVSAQIAGLKAGMTYHVRLTATSAAGTSRGDDVSFTVSAAPAAVTSPATGIGPGAARLNGNVNPNGQATSAYFEYGTTTSYGSRTQTRNLGSGTRAVGVSESLKGLAAATAYHFRIVATNASGTSVGSDLTFTTSLPPASTTGAAQAVTQTTATLTGSVDPHGRSTNWYFQYGPTTAYGSQTQTRGAGSGNGARSVSAALAGLTPGVAYHFRLVATSDAGTSQGADSTFTTPAAVTLAAGGSQVVYGRTVRLTGTVSSRQAGQNVTVLAQRLGDSGFAPIATAITGSGGSWTYLAAPTIRTAYQASWNGGTSQPVMIAVRPAIAFRALARGRFSTRVRAASSFFGRLVQLQRQRADGRWTTVRRARLDRRSAAVFAATLPRGTSRLRVAMSVNQAGSGYLAGFSRTITYVRR